MGPWEVGPLTLDDGVEFGRLARVCGVGHEACVPCAHGLKDDNNDVRAGRPRRCDCLGRCAASDPRFGSQGKLRIGRCTGALEGSAPNEMVEVEAGLFRVFGLFLPQHLLGRIGHDRNSSRTDTPPPLLGGPEPGRQRHQDDDKQQREPGSPRPKPDRGAPLQLPEAKRNQRACRNLEQRERGRHAIVRKDPAEKLRVTDPKEVVDEGAAHMLGHPAHHLLIELRKPLPEAEQQQQRDANEGAEAERANARCPCLDGAEAKGKQTDQSNFEKDRVGCEPERFQHRRATPRARPPEVGDERDSPKRPEDQPGPEVEAAHVAPPASGLPRRKRSRSGLVPGSRKMRSA